MHTPSFHPKARRWAYALGIALGCLAPAAAAAQLLAGPAVLQSEGRPDAVLIADFDDDQILDVIATAPRTNRLNIHSGRGNGQFRFPLSVTIGSGLTDLHIGDIDGNGADDLVGVDEISGDLVILYQYPGTPVPYQLTRLPGEDEPNSLALLDLEQDGDLDVLVAYGGADEVGIYRNLGTQLGPLEHRPVGDGPATLRVLATATPSYALAQRGVLSKNVVIYDSNWAQRQLLAVDPVSDIRPLHWNDDGFLDFLLIDEDGLAQSYLGSAGNWSAGPSWSISPNASTILPYTAQDGRPGAAILEADNHRLVVHLEPTAGPAPDPAWYLGGSVEHMTHADVDADGVPEFYVPLPEDDLILILRRNGDALRGYRSHRVAALPTHMRSHDAIGGLPPRLFALCAIDDVLWSFDQVGDALIPRLPLSVQSNARDFRLGQVDGDGLPDAAVLSLTQGVQLFLSNGSGFAAPIDIPLSGDLRDLELLHLDDDGNLDLAVADVSVHGVRLFHGDGKGSFTAGDTLSSVDPPIIMRARDFDLDGRDDLFVIGSDRRPSLFYRNADGSFLRNFWLLGEQTRGVAIGNFNEDPYPDIAVGNAGDQTYSVLVSLLPRFLAIAEEDRAAPDGSETIAAVDVNHDGLDDLVMSSSTARSVSIHFAVNSGQFAPPSRIRCSTLPLDVHAFDGNGDGSRDIFVTDALGASLVTLGVAPASGEPGSGSPSTSAPEATRLAELSIRPNPAREAMSMRIHSSSAVPSFRVYDLRGRLVERLRARAEGAGWYSAQWSGEEVAAGRYYLQVRAGQAQLSRPLLRLPR